METPEHPQGPQQPPFQPYPQDQPYSHGQVPQPGQPSSSGQFPQQGQPYPQGQFHQEGQPYPQAQPYQQGQPPFQPAGAFPPPSQPPAGPPGSPGAPYQPQPKRKRGKLMAIIVVIALVVIGVGAAGLFFTRDSRSFAAGGETPTDAFQDLIGALNESDFERAYELIDPDERMYVEQLLSRMSAFSDQGSAAKENPRDGEAMMEQLAALLSEHTSVQIEFRVSESAQISDDIALVSAYTVRQVTNRDTAGLADSIVDLLTGEGSDGPSGMTSQMALDGVRESVTGWPSDPLDPPRGVDGSGLSFHAFAQRDGSWYYLPLESLSIKGTLTSNVESSEDLEGWSSHLAGHELMDYRSPAEPEDLGAATVQFVENLGQPIGENFHVLPMVERRTLAIYAYIRSMADDPEIVSCTLSDGCGWWNQVSSVLDNMLGYPDPPFDPASGVTTTQVDVNDEFRLLTIDTMYNMGFFTVDGGQAGFPGCMFSVDRLISEPIYGNAVAAIKDDEGWHLSLGASVVHLLDTMTSDAWSAFYDSMNECN